MTYSMAHHLWVDRSGPHVRSRFQGKASTAGNFGSQFHRPLCDVVKHSNLPHRRIPTSSNMNFSEILRTVSGHLSNLPLLRITNGFSFHCESQMALSSRGNSNMTTSLTTLSIFHGSIFGAVFQWRFVRELEDIEELPGEEVEVSEAAGSLKKERSITWPKICSYCRPLDGSYHRTSGRKNVDGVNLEAHLFNPPCSYLVNHLKTLKVVKDVIKGNNEYSEIYAKFLAVKDWVP
eukprot:Gb_15800 [translate_table: standard]